MIRIAYASTRDPSERELMQLPEAERTREFGSAERRRQFLSGRWLLRSMLSRHDGGPPASYRLRAGDKGKPICENGPAISISHTSDIVACCIADTGDVGIDLEIVSPRRHTRQVARRFFNAAEADWLETQSQDRFFMFWVLKEAYGKAVGCGIVGALRGLQVSVTPPVIEVLKPASGTLGLRLFRLHESFLAVAATTGFAEDVHVECWDVERAMFVDDEEASEVARN